ncbi:endonuclease Q family protein [Alkalihalobacillus sp. CinArs1]|uniref:endonuclease Q family protein n=1 Tax=Alkalihalobacillus sp. CinArs1 TaxID=2995314 RepID=UPI0022DD62C0|nr:endonuclease Q family protein [Alkalihalobacillus sp. CinArs1]
MIDCYADFHIHIGRTSSYKPVKITASDSLTLSSILDEASNRKGLDMIGIIDCHVPEVIADLENEVRVGNGYELDDGGIRFGDLTLILGSEIEIYDENCKGPIHVLVYLPDLITMKHFSEWLIGRMTNIHLSSQRIYEDAQTLQRKVKELGGLFIPAHIFTPFKSLFGRGVSYSLKEVFDISLIDAVELGLSSNTMMADEIAELHALPFLTNSDAHSTPKIAREYQQLKVKTPSFQEWKKALMNVDERHIVRNYGLDPELGKYFETVCAKCETSVHGRECQTCKGTKLIKGVSNRIKELRSTTTKPMRPEYIHHVPLEYIPGIGPKTLSRLLDHFGNEMNILHRAKEKELATVVSSKIARLINLARNGELTIEKGGGGKYGKVRTEE